MIRYLIESGTVIDGSGAEPREINIGIHNDRIVYAGSERVAAERTVNARGLIVAPGFIDTHSHSEFTILADGRAEGKLSQGITTEINGNCGLSAAPLFGEALIRRQADMDELGITLRWSNFQEYFALLRRKGIAINFATLCGHGNIRGSVIGYRNSAADGSDMAEMKRLLSDAVAAGAKGLSTGLIYPPGIYSDTSELTALARALKSPSDLQGTRATALPFQGVYASHMRSEGDALIESIQEMLEIGRGAGAPIHISHLKTAGERNWWKIDNALSLIANAQSEGINITCDRYPYVAASTDLDTILPSWVYEGGVEEELARLKKPETAARIKSDISRKDDNYWKGVYISSVVNPENSWMEGENIFDIASKTGKNIVEALLELLIHERTRTGAIFFSMSENNLRRFMSLPFLMIGSDSAVRSFSGPTCSGKPHPRGFGSFPRFVGRYVRDEGLVTLPEAIRRTTALPAATFGLANRGTIREGAYADIVIFNYERIIDTATFREPFSRPEGIEYVFVNGGMAVDGGEITGILSGTVLS
ncbi:MAG: D-aminoacylase [Dissulfurispiraceae bacterium]|jgi:N-acyl-D-amino-acid deacylase